MKTRDAEILARLLDGDRPDEVARDVAALASLAKTIERRAVAPRTEFRDALRERLLAEAAKAPSPWRARLRTAVEDGLGLLRHTTRTATASALAVAALLVGGVAVAAQSALPGDAFHAVKTAIEEARLDRATTVTERGLLLLDIAEVRISEAERAVEAARPDSAEDALIRADEAVRASAELLIGEFVDTGEATAYRPLLAFVQEQRPRLARLSGRLVGAPRGARGGRGARARPRPPGPRRAGGPRGRCRRSGGRC
jgi:hypothetical protein